MTKVYAALDRLLAHHARNLLESAGIRVTLLNENVAGAMGEVPFLECETELWVDDRLAARAREILRESLEAPLAGGPAWLCPCGETIEPQFAQCWNCGATAPQTGWPRG